MGRRRGLLAGGESRGRGSGGLVQRGLNQSGTSPALGVKIAFGWGTEQGEPMRKFIAGTRRRTLLKASAAASLLAVVPSALRAQPKIAPPNIIKAGTLVMSINPTLPPLQFVDDKGNPQGMKTVDDLAGKRISVELGGIEERRTREVNDIVTKKGLKPVTVMTFHNFAEAFQALKAGPSDAATCIDATAM